MRIHLLIIVVLFSINGTVLSQVNLNNGLVLYLGFNGNANDLSGNGNNGTINGPILVQDKWGNPNGAYKFNGISDFIRVNHNSNLNFPNDKFTLYALVNIHGFYQGTCHGNVIMNKSIDWTSGMYSLRFDDNAYFNGQHCSILNVDSTHQNFYSTKNNQSGPTVYYTPPIVKNKWYCVIAVCDSTQTKLYVDGVLKSTANSAGLGGTSSADLYIGKMDLAPYPYWLNGTIDELRIYNRAINLQEIDSLCNFIYEPNPSSVNAHFNYLIPNPCLSLETKFSDSSWANNALITSWEWNFGDGYSSSLQNPSHTYNNPGSYVVELITTNSKNQKDTFSTLLNIQSGIKITATPGQSSICLGDSIKITASGGTSYTWSPNTGINSTTSNAIWCKPTTTTTYTVLGTDANGCTGSAQIEVEVFEELELQLSKSNDIYCNQLAVQLSAIGANNYSWRPGVFLTDSTTDKPIANITKTTTFTVTGKNGNCEGAADITVYYYNNSEAGLFVPNAFTPNGDGLNDCYKIFNQGHYERYELKIYNRWAQLIWGTNNPRAC